MFKKKMELKVECPACLIIDIRDIQLPPWFKALPESIPVGDAHNFFGYVPNREKVVDTVRLCQDCCKPVTGADPIRSLSDWSDSVIVDRRGGRKAGTKKIWDGEPEKIVFLAPYANRNYKQDPSQGGWHQQNRSEDEIERNVPWT
ncbi:hypothetical protein C8R45DRAFT_931260 [Mycena sanguinolenta]|nr:hypothetical protein C8R45DRAFT_931260 [Mycena sanguinolenta]